MELIRVDGKIVNFTEWVELESMELYNLFGFDEMFGE
jgi:hypothetical protein